MAEGIRLVQPRKVTGTGEGLVSHAGLVWLAQVADGVGLTDGFVDATSALEWRKHRPGRSLAQLTLALADGADCVSDLAGLRDQQALFGTVPSHPTAWRTFDRLGPVELAGLDTAINTARARAWAAGAGPDDDALFIADFDATIVRTRADKQDARPTYKRTYGHHPLLAMDTDTGEILAMALRPGNAGSNTAADHVSLLDEVLAGLPFAPTPLDTDTDGDGDGDGDGEGGIQRALRAVLVRSDAAGATHWFAEHCRASQCRFSFGYQIAGSVRDALLLVDEDDWTPAVNGDGKARTNAQVVEITDLVELAKWPTGTRLIVRRERPHPGAQLSLFDSVNGYRHQAVLTDQTGDPVTLELRHRQRARAEQIIRDAKACGLDNLPFDCVVNNTIWTKLVTAAVNLLAWAKRLTLTGPLRRATPKTIRYRLLHVAGRVNTRRLDLDRHWPWTTTITDALDRLHTRLRPPTVTTT